MNQINRVSTFAPAVALDMGRELTHWRSAYPHARCFKSGHGFERYAPTIKFGYETYADNQKKSEEELFPRLCHQYKDGVAACDRIDWAEAKVIVAATWERLRTLEPTRLAAVREIRRLTVRGRTPSSPSHVLRWNWLLTQPGGLHASSTAPRQAAAY